MRLVYFSNATWLDQGKEKDIIISLKLGAGFFRPEGAILQNPFLFLRRVIMTVRKAEAVWEGNLQEGRGTMKLGSGAFEGPYTFKSRFEEGPGTNPEELIGAAHAGCFSMFLSAVLSKAGYMVERIQTTAQVHLEEGPTITRIHLDTKAQVPGVDEKTFQEQVEVSKKGCPVSKALTGVEISVNASLVS
jgi:osmotically inducible protein OsmC